MAKQSKQASVIQTLKTELSKQSLRSPIPIVHYLNNPTRVIIGGTINLEQLARAILKWHRASLKKE